jgi:hypothetical protein
MEQNYFQFQQKYFRQRSAPTSAIISVAYNKNIEQKQIYPVLIKHQMTGYFRYADDILLTYDKSLVDIIK